MTDTKYKKHRTWVKGHDRSKPGLSCGNVRVRGHVRELDTKGQVRRKEKGRLKHARDVDEAIRAEGTKSFPNQKNREKWQKDPGSTDIAGVDT